VALDERLTSRTAHVAPRTPLEHQLAEVWREVLEIGHDGIDDDFFLVGGDSILATTLLVKVTEKLGTYVSLVDFMEAPTIRGLAAAVERQRYSGAPGGAAGLVAIQPDGAEVPLFCVPPLDGSLVGFGLLSSHLGRDRPMWGFGQPASRADDAPNTIEDIAAAYVATMRAMRPGGPYLLLGDCFGGFVAYEMACQLGRGGEEPAFLGMVDTPYRRGWRQNTSLPTALAVRAKHGLVRARYQFSVLTQLSGNERLQYLRERVAGLVSRIRDRYWGLVRRTFLRLELTPPVAARDPRYANEWAEARYEPDAFRGRVTFFKTTDPSPGFYLPDLQGWENLFLGESRLIQLPGEHRFRYRKETLEVLARALRVELVRQSREPDARVGPLLTERPHRGNDVARNRWKLPPRTEL
jgi:thioesterase domain-containing protein/acyl carrier protein